MSYKNYDYDYLFKVEYKIEPPIPPTFQLGISHIRDGNYGEKPEKFCEEAVDYLININSREATINTAVLFNILAFIYKNRKEYINSIDCLVIALRLYLKVLGEDDLRVADIHNNLAVMFQKCRMYEEAKHNCLKAAEIMKRVLGPSHFDVQVQFAKFSIFYEKAEQCGKTSFWINLFSVKLIFKKLISNIYKKVVGPVQQSTATKLKVD